MTVSSDRATKGQGGNEFVESVVTNHLKEKIAVLSFYPDGRARFTVRADISVDYDRAKSIE